MGDVRATGEGRGAGGVEVVDGIADGLVVAVQVGGNGSGALALRAGKQDLAAAQGEGIGGAETRLERLPLVVGQRTDKDRSWHA